MKSSQVSIKTRSTPASLSFKGQVTRHTTVNWSITYISLALEILLTAKPDFHITSHFEFHKVVTEIFYPNPHFTHIDKPNCFR